MSRKAVLVRALWAAAGLAIAAVIADVLGVTRPNPPAARVIAEMERAVARLRNHQAQVSLGEWGPAAAGIPVSAVEHASRDDDQLVLVTSDVAGFRHAERWQGNTWSYFQPGAELQFDTRITGSDRVPFARWLVSGMPSLDDLTQVIREANGPHVTGRAQGSDGEVWVLECQVEAPALLGALPASHSAHPFTARLFGRRWTVHVSRKTHLPEHITISGGDYPAPVRIGVEQVREGRLAGDWRETVARPAASLRVIRYDCDLRAPEALPDLRQKLQRAVDEWRSPLMRKRAARPSPTKQ